MNGFFLVATGGAIGASLRHAAGLAAVRFAPAGWPYATFFVNVAGSFAMGLVIGWLALKGGAGGQATRLFLATGILGGFTTFSAFSLEVAKMVERGAMARAASYAGLSVALGLGALFAGLWLARRALA
ncbi:MAG: fluoride efflux transporter CrcB [Pseudomonadota bacterium]